ncbi:DUF4156 domain-containing protein [Fluoribacter dumoffii]|uniref:Outer membrane lipoprotein n=2 Tax=Legionellaceae TaxID=444 RepID=A0A0W0SDB2_9GAMM|nr:MULTISPECIES: DUF4156 domain-containing protein [Legionellaceae]HAT1993803.1 DUF4156 domain-containing protein [Legionella pneumophila]KTC81099.1 outer membrane lipoprotein [Legionella cherrii]KTC91295.1 outer membrane lipoprotein [Fluoribacter dumoffii NY 23]MCW8416917.1 DUF4156 domain-containing protein [Fluoribacter dumoffii]MCW8455243.1 DUF4156 domain-containing protein [Fluoribacter dumoffii]
MRKEIFFSILLALQFIVGCVPRSLEPNAKKVVIIYNQSTMAKSCEFLGKIFNSDVHGKKLHFTLGLEKNLKTDDLNFLKNEGAKLGANLVVFEEHHTSIERYHPQPGHITDISIHAIYAKAYRCPPNLIKSMEQLNEYHHAYKNPVITKNN